MSHYHHQASELLTDLPSWGLKNLSSKEKSAKPLSSACMQVPDGQ